MSTTAREAQTNKKVRVTTHTSATLTSSSTCIPGDGAVNQEFHTLVKQGRLTHHINHNYTTRIVKIKSVHMFK